MLCVFGSITCNALDYEIPYDTYTYWFTGSGSKTASVNAIYETGRVISSNSLGVGSFESLDDVYTSDSGYTYILDGNASKITVLNADYSFLKEISEIRKPNGETLNFSGAKNIYVKNSTIYISDTENERVILSDDNGNYLYEYQKPDSPLIPEGFAYKPIRTFTDSYGYVYVLCDGSYYGAILFNEKREFVGFFGANTVKNGVLGSFQNALSRMFVNNTKKGATATALPYVFSDLYVDSNNFVYTATGYTKNLRAGQIKKLNPGGGSNILNSDSINFTDVEINRSINNGKNLNQDILSLEVDDKGYIYALDSGHGKVFVYNQNCMLIAAFGGGMHNGEQKGTFVSAGAITVNGNDVLVTDAVKKTVTVFNKTEFGSKLFEAGYYTVNGDYEKALPIWREVIAKDANCSFAYSGIALALLKQENYEEAMKYAKLGYDRETYALAFSEVRNKFLEKNFLPIIICSVVFIALIVMAVVICKKKKVAVNNEEILFLLRVPFHPAKSFYKIQEKKLGSVAACIVILIIYYVSSITKNMFGGFAFSSYDPLLFNSFQFLVRSVGIIVLWIIVNWAVSTIFGGRGKVKEIAVVTCYSLIPMIVGNFLSVILSNVLVPTEGEFIGIIYTILQIYTLLLIVIGTVVIHDYDFKHFIGTTLLTLLGIAIVIFLMIMVILLVQQFWVFLVTVFTELTL